MSGYNTRNRKDTVTFADLIELFDEKLKKIVMKEDINELKEIIENQKKKIDKQQSEIESLQTKVRHLENDNESLEQYGRRTCLRLIGIPPPENGNETGEDCLKKVQHLIQELAVDIPSSCVDRAHRIGKPFKRRDGSTAQTIIVKFTTWRHKTLLYRKRNNEICKNKKLQMYLDLTKKRNGILKDAREKVKNFSNVDFVFANVNCQLCLKFKDSDKSHYFNDLDDLDVILDHE